MNLSHPTAFAFPRRRALHAGFGALAVAASLGVLLLEPRNPAAAFADPMLQAGWRAPASFARPGAQLAVIRERNGVQNVERDHLGVAPGDRLRVLFELSSRQLLGAAMLSDDGTWTPLFDDAFEAGLHIPLAQLEIGERPRSGWIVLGSPPALRAARDSGVLSEALRSVEIEWQGP